jgi:hypothetical protein
MTRIDVPTLLSAVRPCCRLRPILHRSKANRGGAIHPNDGLDRMTAYRAIVPLFIA